MTTEGGTVQENLFVENLPESKWCYESMQRRLAISSHVSQNLQQQKLYRCKNNCRDSSRIQRWLSEKCLHYTFEHSCRVFKANEIIPFLNTEANKVRYLKRVETDYYFLIFLPALYNWSKREDSIWTYL